jgi:glutathione S-transferase
LVKHRQLLLLEKMELMEQRLSDGRPWLLGDDFTLADIALAPRVDMFPAVGISDLYQRFPNIGAFMHRMKARASWERSGVRPEPGETERVIEPIAA